LNKKTSELPEFYKEMIKNEMGPLWDSLPEGAIFHDQNAYLKSMEKRIAV